MCGHYAISVVNAKRKELLLLSCIEVMLICLFFAEEILFRLYSTLGKKLTTRVPLPCLLCRLV